VQRLGLKKRMAGLVAGLGSGHFRVGVGCHPLVDAQTRDDEFNHATCVVVGVVLRTDTEIAEAEEQF